MDAMDSVTKRNSVLGAVFYAAQATFATTVLVALISVMTIRQGNDVNEPSLWLIIIAGSGLILLLSPLRKSFGLANPKLTIALGLPVYVLFTFLVAWLVAQSL